MIFVNAPVVGNVDAGVRVVACLRPGLATPAKVGPLKIRAQRLHEAKK